MIVPLYAMEWLPDSKVADALRSTPSQRFNMNSHDGLLSQLEVALSNRDLSRRAEVLRRVTDLFVLGSGAFAPDQIELFDEVMGRLVENIDVALRAEVSGRLARQADAPTRVVQTLAFDDAIEVAGPVLRHSARLNEAALVENAMTKGQGHLLAISGREVLSQALTGVLIERGDRAVVRSTVDNRGARLSSGTLSNLTKRSRDDGDLAMSLWMRSDIPRQMLVKVFAEASELTKKTLEAEHPRQAVAIRDAVAATTNRIQVQARASSETHGRDYDAVAALYALGKLDEAHLFKFASEGAFDRTVSALSLLCDIPIGLVERCLVQTRTEQVLVLAKAIELSWRTTAALIFMQAEGGGISRSQFDQYFATFSRLQKKTAQTALQFYRMREMARG
jgi:uncharacterized protein (DUF2336 family)